MPDLTTVVTLDLRYQRAPSVPPSDAPIFPSLPERRAWGSDCLLVPTADLDRGATPDRDAGPRPSGRAHVDGAKPRAADR
jgi:hypothetical protein